MFTYRNRHKDVHYTKLSSHSKRSDDDDSDETELYVRKQFKEIPTEDKTIQEGDTLQALSLRYHCPIAELKRLNNIHKENEIYARNTIKVPARPFSNILAGIHSSGKSSPEVKAATQKNEIDENLLTDKLYSFKQNTSNEHYFNAVIFNSNIKTCDTENIENIDASETNIEEVQLLPNSVNLVSEPVVSRFACSGADADISWITLIVCIVIVIFAIPLIYIFYIAEHPEEYHHKPHNNLT